MKFLLVLAILMSVLVFSYQAEGDKAGDAKPEGDKAAAGADTGASDDKAGGDAGKTGGDAGLTEGDAGKTGGEGTKTGGDAGDQGPADSGDKKPEKGGDDAGTTADKGTTKEEGGNNSTTESKDVSIYEKALADEKTGEKCKANIMYCYGSTSTDKATKDKMADLKGDDKEKVCDLFKSGKACMVKKNAENQCSEDEYEKLETVFCFSPRTMASLALVFVLCLVSKLFGHQ